MKLSSVYRITGTRLKGHRPGRLVTQTLAPLPSVSLRAVSIGIGEEQGFASVAITLLQWCQVTKH